jgi:RHS repeat-associated protein
VRLIRTLGLVTLAALMAMAFLGASSAVAETALCEEDEAECAEPVTHVHEATLSGAKAKFLSSVLNIECDVLFLGDALGEGLGEPLVIEGTFTYSNCNNSCTTTEENGPAEIEVSKTGHETAEVTGEGLVHVTCGGFINCRYNHVGLSGTANGPLLSAQANGEVSIAGQTLNKESGVLCPSTTKLDITTTPLEQAFIASEPLPIEPQEEETEGRCNPALIASASCISGGSVNPATGNLVEEQTDIPTLGGRGPGLHVTRSYNSRLASRQTASGPFGYGWSGPYSASLSFSAGSAIATVRQDNGAAAVFYKQEGKYVPPAWDLATLKKSGENWIFTLPSQLQLEFDKSGQLTKETDRHKNAITLTYKEGHLETAKDAAGRTLTFAYNAGKVESIKDPLGNTVKYGYESNNLVKVTLPGEEKANWTFKYDAFHQLTEATDGRGNTTTIAYESQRVKSQTDALERKYSFEYKEKEGVKETTITQPNSSKTLQKLNAMGEPTETTLASGTELAQTTKRKFTNAYALEELTDPNGHVTKYGYDSEGNKTSEKDANENKTEWTYNSTHDVKTETTPKGETTTYVRNAAGDPEEIERPAPKSKTQKTEFKWAENGDLEEETDPLNQETTFEYDSYGNLKAEIDPEGDKRTWGHNEDGRITSEVSPRGYEAGKEPTEYETEIARDPQGRPEVVTDPLGHKTKRKYDAAGNLEVLTNSNEHATTYVYDKANQLVEVKYANGNTAKTDYDSMGEVKSKTDGNNQMTKYERNLLEQVKEVIDPLERKTTMEYYAAGNLKKTKDPENRTITYSYYANDRLEKVDYSDASTADVTYEYGKDGEVANMTDGTGTSEYTYDELDRLTEVENGAGEIVEYEYDLGNQITEITYPNGKVVTQGFDEAGRLESVKDWLGGETKFAYNRNSALKTTTFPAASENKDEYAYDEAGQLEATTMKKGAATLASIAYARDKAGQLETATQTGLPGAAEVKYKYDERERLKEGAGTSFEYDPANNPTKLGTTTLKYDKASQLEKAGTTKYAFDKFGQRTKAEPEGGTATTYGYDQAGNLVSVTKSGSIEDTYAYDGDGLRASQKISGAKAQLTWDVSGELPLLLYDGTNDYIYGPEGLPFEQIAGETATYLHHDHLGSTRLLTNSSGEAKGKYTYTPYGEVEEHTGTASTPLGFNGQYRNESTGLIYLRKRVYDPKTAQFLSVDPLVAETGETYGYAGQSPVNGGDPTGLCQNRAIQLPPGVTNPAHTTSSANTRATVLVFTSRQRWRRYDLTFPAGTLWTLDTQTGLWYTTVPEEVTLSNGQVGYINQRAWLVPSPELPTWTPPPPVPRFGTPIPLDGPPGPGAIQIPPPSRPPIITVIPNTPTQSYHETLPRPSYPPNLPTLPGPY